MKTPFLELTSISLCHVKHPRITLQLHVIITIIIINWKYLVSDSIIHNRVN